MKNLKSGKIIIALVLGLMMMVGLTVNSYADEAQKISPKEVVNSSSNESAANTNANSNNTNKNVSNTNNTSNTNKTSSYNTNNTNLPSTGLKDSSFLFVIVGALIVIAVVAYNKVKLYKNI